jgi:hypothetical protein
MQVDTRKIQRASFKLTKYRGGGRRSTVPGSVDSSVIAEAARDGS